MLTDALHARTGGDLGAASLPRHLRRRATSHNPYRGSTKHRPNAKRRRAVDATGLAPADVASRVGHATGAGVRVGTNPGVTVHWCRRARRRPARLHAKHVDDAGGTEKEASRDAEETGTDDDDDELLDAMLARVEDVCGDDPSARTGPDAVAAASAKCLRRLETHVWHAKRFEMRTRWGFSLPESRPGRRRGYRSTSRWVRDACAVHDGSYNACVRVEAGDVRACLSRCVEGGVVDVDPRKADARDFILVRTTGEVIAPAQIVSLPGVVEGDAEQGGAVLIWVHPDAVDDCEASLSNAGASVTRVRSLCRLELTGETARSSLSAICDVGQPWEDASWRVLRCETRGDPREAAWLAKKGGASSSPSVFQSRDDGSVGRTPMEYAVRPATAQELGARRREARKRSSGLHEKEAPDDSDSLPGCPVVVVRRARGPLATSHPGFTIIAPRGWAQPLLLALAHLGARAAGRVEWGWLATQAGTSRFPEDFPDTDAGKRWFAAVEDRNAARADVVPRGKRTPERTVVVGANLAVRRTSPGKFPAKGSEGSGTRQKRGKSGWRPVRDGAPLSSSSSSSFVRCVVRCPWGGRARVGDAVLDPARDRESAWRSGVGRNRRHVGDGLAEVGTPIGVVTSASPPGASVGVASALVNVAALRTVCSRAYSPATVSRKNEQKRGGRRALVFLAAAARGGDGGDGGDGDGPEAFVPAELTPALEAAPDGVDSAWW